MLSIRNDKRLLWPTVMTAVAFAGLMALGNWQLARKAWKEEILAAVAERAAAPPLAAKEAAGLVCVPADRGGVLAACDYRRLRIEGSFDHGAERHVFAGVQKTPQGAMPGYWIFTPLRLSGPAAPEAGGTVLVNRGFVPEALKQPAARAAGQVEGMQTITAQIRTRQQRSWSDGADDPVKNVHYVRDPVELGAAATPGSGQAGGAPALASSQFYLELVEGAPPGGFPLPLAGAVELPNRHLEYALTWFGLGAALLAVYAAFAWSRLRSG